MDGQPLILSLESHGRIRATLVALSHKLNLLRERSAELRLHQCEQASLRMEMQAVAEHNCAMSKLDGNAGWRPSE
jgi:hypothetical protein